MRCRDRVLLGVVVAVYGSDRIRHASEGFVCCADCKHIEKATDEQIISVGECGLCTCPKCGSGRCTTKNRAVLAGEGITV